MPLTRISMRKGKSQAYKRAILDNIYLAMREVFDVAEEARFMLIHEHDAEDFLYGATYRQIARSDDLLIIQIFANNTRTVEQKKALYRLIADRLAESPGVRPEDVFINLVDIPVENWSVGHGLAQYI